jgi:hypothetical protein
MTQRIVALALALFATTPVNAEIDLVKVATPCGTLEDVYDLLHPKMPTSTTIGKGGDSRGEQIAILLTGEDYWALVATLAPGRVCVVASGRNWTVTEPGAAKAF